MPMLEVAMRVKRFAVPVTFTLVVRVFDVVRALVKKALPRTYRFVEPGSALIPMFEATKRVERFEAPVTFKEIPKIDAAFMVVALVVARFEVPVVLRVAVKRLEAFITRALPLVNTFRVAMFERV